MKSILARPVGGVAARKQGSARDGSKPSDSASVASARADLPALHDVVLQSATHHADEPAFRALWRALVADSGSPEKIHQSPEYFDVLRGKPGVRVEVLSLLRLSDSAIVGIVPVLIETRFLRFHAGPLKMGRIGVEMATLLGSVPAVPMSDTIVEYLVVQLLEQFPACKAVLAPSMPRDSACRRHIQQFCSRGLLGTSLMGPWRGCHLAPLPPSFDLYTAQLSRKKRYNIKRQIRQLAEQAGALDMECIVDDAQVRPFMAALRALATAAELAALMNEATMLATSRRGLLRSYVLRGGGAPLGVLLATCSAGVLHVHNIFTEQAHASLSVGTTIMHLAVQDLIEQGGFTSIDFGYGTPNQEFRSTHVLEVRAQLLLFDRRKSVSLLFFLYTAFLLTSETAIGMIKSLRHALRSLIRATLG